MNHDPGNLLKFLGSFHVLWVHLPIGGLVLLGYLELLAAFTRQKDAVKNNRWILGFVSATVVVTAACGWMLAQGDGYDPELLKWHLLRMTTTTCLPKARRNRCPNKSSCSSGGSTRVRPSLKKSRNWTLMQKYAA